MKKAFTLAACALFLCAAPAQAQFHSYAPSRKPAVEMNLDIVGDAAAPAALPPVAVERQELEPAREPLPPVALRAPAPSASPAPAPPPPVMAQEEARETQAPRLLKPLFTARESAPGRRAAPAEDPRPARDETPAPALARAPLAPPAPATVVPPLDDLTLVFEGDSSAIAPGEERKLQAVIAQMQETEGRLQVRAYAQGEGGNRSSARRISLSRALSIRSYLMDHGIKPGRVDVRALGAETESAPLDRADLVFAR